MGSLNQICPVTEEWCSRDCERICRNYVNGKVAPIRDRRIIEALAWRLLRQAIEKITGS